MKFDGSNVTLSAQQGGISIHLRKDGEKLVEVTLSEEDGARLLSFLITAYGLADAIGIEEAEGFEPVEEDPVDNKRTTH